MNFIKKVSKNISFILAFTLVFLFFSSIAVLAQNQSNTGTPAASQFSKLNNPIKSKTIQEFVRNILEGVIKIGVPLVALAIIYSGFLFVSAIGNPGKIEEAKSALVNTLIGAALLLGAWALAELVVNTVQDL